MKLYFILFESEEHYQQSFGFSGKLNRHDAREFYNVFKERGKNFLFWYDVNGLTKEAALETDTPKDGGILVPKRNNGYGDNALIAHSNAQLITIDTKDNRIIIHPTSRFPLHDPRVTLQLSSLAEVFPEFAEFNVLLQEWDDEENKNKFQPLGTLKDLVGSKKLISGKYKEYSRKDPTYKEYKFEVFKELKDIEWFHATRRSNLNAIKRAGIIPAKQFQNPQQHGWTFLNFDLQNAVYITANKKYAFQIAEAIKDKFDETAVVLRISGDALKDQSRIVVDEDALRNEYDDSVSGNQALSGMPEYISSMLHKVESIAYEGVISPQYISYEGKVEFENKKDEREESEE